MNNAVFLTYLEEVRDEWLGRALGDPAKTWNWVLARVAIDFRREVTLADELVVARCGLGSIGTSSIRTREEVVTRDGELAAEAEAVLVARNRESGRSRPITADERVAFERVSS